jgi:SAM-dependent methyltransferase
MSGAHAAHQIGKLTARMPAECAAGCGVAVRTRYVVGSHIINRCSRCGLYMLAADESGADTAQLDRSQFDAALRPLRTANYARILQRLGQILPLAGRKLLDVGCSSGWFLESARAAGCECYGLEPDTFFYERLAGGPLVQTQLVRGYFPDDVPADWGPFDIITFHDVFEHLPDPARVLAATRARLVPGGLLVLSLPVADGFVFRLATLLYHFGVTAPLARVFQLRYPFPHLFYFTRDSLLQLARQSGFAPLAVERLRSFSTRGALHRSRMDSTRHFSDVVTRYAGATALLMFAVLEPLLPADSVLVILRAVDP